MKKEKNEHLKKLKRIKILDFLMFFGRNKIGFKFLEDKVHYTIKFLTDDMVNFHETIEGEEKKYPRTGKLDIKKFAQAKETLERELPNILKEIDINDPKYENVVVIICPTREKIKRAIEVKRKEITVKKNNFYDMFFSVPMKDLQDYDFQVAFWAKEGEEQALLRIDGKYFLLKVDDFEKVFDKIRKRLIIQGFD